MTKIVGGPVPPPIPEEQRTIFRKGKEKGEQDKERVFGKQPVGVVYLGEFGVPKTTATVDTMVWIQRFAIETDRASEHFDLYQLLGDEVPVEPVSPDLLVAEERVDCLLADCERYVVLYTRPANVWKSEGT